MQAYNYADEIIKDTDSPLPVKRYVKYYGYTGEDIFNIDENKSIFISDLSLLENDQSVSNNKIAAFKEGLKNDNIFL